MQDEGLRPSTRDHLCRESCLHSITRSLSPHPRPPHKPAQGFSPCQHASSLMGVFETSKSFLMSLSWSQEVRVRPWGRPEPRELPRLLGQWGQAQNFASGGHRNNGFPTFPQTVKFSWSVPGRVYSASLCSSLYFQFNKRVSPHLVTGQLGQVLDM